MKKKDIQELHSKSKSGLKDLIKKVEEELVRIKAEKEAGSLKKIHQIAIKKRDLARLKTILREKELNENI